MYSTPIRTHSAQQVRYYDLEIPGHPPRTWTPCLVLEARSPNFSVHRAVWKSQLWGVERSLASDLTLRVCSSTTISLLASGTAVGCRTPFVRLSSLPTSFSNPIFLAFQYFAQAPAIFSFPGLKQYGRAPLSFLSICRSYSLPKPIVITAYPLIALSLASTQTRFYRLHYHLIDHYHEAMDGGDHTNTPLCRNY
jgi:hypothetical protein